MYPWTCQAVVFGAEIGEKQRQVIPEPVLQRLLRLIKLNGTGGCCAAGRRHHSTQGLAFDLLALSNEKSALRAYVKSGGPGNPGRPCEF